MNGIVTFRDLAWVFGMGWAAGILTVFVVGFIAMFISLSDRRK